MNTPGFPGPDCTGLPAQFMQRVDSTVPGSGSLSVQQTARITCTAARQEKYPAGSHGANRGWDGTGKPDNPAPPIV